MVKIDVVDCDGSEFDDLCTVLHGLLNQAQQGEVAAYAPQAYAFSLIVDENQVGGLVGEVLWDWFYIKLLAVDPSYQGKGFGASLVEKAEEVAEERSCSGIWVNTYSFQAPNFYTRLGFKEFGRLNDNPVGHDRIFLAKPF